MHTRRRSSCIVCCDTLRPCVCRRFSCKQGRLRKAGFRPRRPHCRRRAGFIGQNNTFVGKHRDTRAFLHRCPLGAFRDDDGFIRPDNTRRTLGDAHIVHSDLRCRPCRLCADRLHRCNLSLGALCRLTVDLPVHLRHVELFLRRALSRRLLNAHRRGCGKAYLLFFRKLHLCNGFFHRLDFFFGELVNPPHTACNALFLCVRECRRVSLRCVLRHLCGLCRPPCA